MVPVKVAPLFVTVRKPVSTDTFAAPIQTDPVFPGDSHIAGCSCPTRGYLVVIVKFRDGKLAHEHIYWDQASVLKQIGLINDPALPVRGAETAQKVLDPRYTSRERPPDRR